MSPRPMLPQPMAPTRMRSEAAGLSSWPSAAADTNVGAARLRKRRRESVIARISDRGTWMHDEVNKTGMQAFDARATTPPEILAMLTRAATEGGPYNLRLLGTTE